MSNDARAPRVSVVMAVHDGERYIGAAVDSILGQQLGDLELIVVDDGSTDRSAEIVRARDDRRVRLITNERNLGLAPSLNVGLAAARGELVARLDADDVALPQRLARQVAFMDANPRVALLGSWYREMAADGTPGALVKLPTEHWELRWHMCLYSPFAHSAVLWRRTLVAERVGAYDERLAYSMDFDLWRRIAERLEVANVPESLLHLRAHERSMTATYGERAREGLRMQAAYAARLLGWPDSDGENHTTRLQRLYRMFISRPRDRSQAELLADAAEVVRLHEAFVHDAGVPIDVARQERRKVRERLARQLLWASRTASDGQRRGASGELLRAVATLAPGAFLSRESVDAAIGLTARVLKRP
ncbi:MAG: glycosyltransferase [Gemmatimonadetes bacterium]|nr:glycosyltransferase [Gemmatimonadota bacterium]